MQSSTPFSNSSTTQEERPNGADDGRHRGNEEVSTISEGNISVPDEQHVKTIRDVHDFIPQPSKRRGLRKLSQFPEKLMSILDSKEYEAIFSWNKKGDAIVIHKPYDLVGEVLKTHFEARDNMKFDSFVRKLYRWGFSKLDDAEGKDIYFHPNFRQGDYESCSKVFCTSKPSSTRRRERNDMPLPYDGQNEPLDLAGSQPQMLSSSLFNGNPLDFIARLSPQIQEYGAAPRPVNHNIIGDRVDSFLGNNNESMAAPKHQQHISTMSPDEMNLRLLHMNTMANGGGQPFANAADMLHQQMGSGLLNPIQNHHQTTGQEGLHASLPNSLTNSQQNITLNTASSSSRMPGHIPFQSPSFLRGTTSFHQTVDYSQLLGNDSTNMTVSQEIEELRKGNDLILHFINNLLRDQSISPRQHMPQLLNRINIASSPTSSIIGNSIMKDQPNNNIFPSGTNLTQNNPHNEISTTHAASDHTFKELEAFQHVKGTLVDFQSNMPTSENGHQSAHLFPHDTMVTAARMASTKNIPQTKCAMVRTFQQHPEELALLSPADKQSESPPANNQSLGGGSTQLYETEGMNEKLSTGRSIREPNNNIGPSYQRRRLSNN